MDRILERVIRINEHIVNSNIIVADLNRQILMLVRANRYASRNANRNANRSVNGNNRNINARRGGPPPYNVTE